MLMKKLLFTLVALLVALTGFAADNLLSGGKNLPAMLQRSGHEYTDAERGYLVDGVKNATESDVVNLDLYYEEQNDGFYFDLGTTTKIGVVKIFWTGKHCTKYKIYGSNEVPTLDSPGTEIGSFDEYGALNDDTRYKSYAGGAGQEFQYISYVPDVTANFYGSMMSEFEIFSYEESVLTSLSLNTQISVYNTAGNGFNAAPIDQNGNSMSSGVTYTADNGATINANGNAFTLVAPAAGVYTVTATAGDKTATTKVALLDASGLLAAPTNNSNSVQTIFCDTYSSTEPGISDPGWNWKYTTRARPEIASGNYIYIVDKVGTFGLNPGAVDLSEYDKLNLDIYAVEATSGYVVVEGANPNLNLPFTLSAGWNRLALDVSESTATAATWIQVYVGANNADNNRSIAVDNVFYSMPEVDDSEAPVLEAPVVASVNASSATLSLKATDDKATSIKYTITYGENSITATGASGETTEVIVSGLTPETDYTFSVVANDGKNDSESKTVNATTTAMPKAPVPAPARSVSIYGTKLGNATGYGWYDWGGGSGSVTTLKNTDNEDIEAYVISNFKWFGSQFGQIDAIAAEMKTLHFDIYSATTTTLAVVPINAALEGNGNQPEKGYQFNITGGEWNAIEVPVADVIADGVSMTKLYQIKYVSKVANKAAVGTSDGFENGDGTLSFIVANVYLEGDPIIDTENPVLVTAEAVTGAETTTSVTLSLKASDDKAATIKYEIVNDSDENHRFTTSGAKGETITYELTGLEPGTEYNFNVTAYDAAENASTAAQVTVSTKAIAVPGVAPQPTTATENVKSVYSDQYTSLANLEFANWAGTAKGQGKKELATGDQAYYVIGLGNIFGLDFHETLDVTGMEKLHLDIWSEAAQTIKISPIWGETKDDQKEVSLTAGEWTSVDLTLADFANIDLTSVYQIELLNGDGTSVIYLDNIYFWKSTGGEVPTTEKTVYLNPAIWEVNGEDSEWNEVFAAYVYGDGLDASWLTMDKVDDTPYYTVAIPASYTGLIFTRRQVGTEMNWDNVWNQTVDIDFTSVEDNTLFTITAWHENDDESKPSTVESTLYVEPTSFTVTFKNSIGWENVYAYTYNSETLGAWPGKAMTIVDGVYTISFKAVAAPANIIFNNGGSGEGNQTEDLVFENGKEYDIVVPEELPEPATAPEEAADDVLAIYSETYEAALNLTDVGSGNKGAISNSGWNGGYDTAEEKTLAANDNTVKVTDAVCFGVQAGTADITDYDFLNVAIWSTIDFTGHIQIEGTGMTNLPISLEANKWNYVKVELSGARTGATWIQLYVGAADNKNTIFVDNIYFSKLPAGELIVGEPDTQGVVALKGELTNENKSALESLDAAVIDLTGVKIEESVTAITTANPNVFFIVPGTVENNVATSDLSDQLAGNLIVKRNDGYYFPISQLEIVDDGQSPVWTGFFVSTNTVGYAYSRTIPAGEYTTAYLPAASTAVEGLKVYTFKSYENSQIELEEKTDGVVPANTPVVLYNATDADLTITAEGTGDLNFGGTPATVEQGGATFTGNYKVEEAENLFTIGAAASAAPARHAQSGSTLTVKAVEGKTVPFRAYFKGVTEGEDISTAIDGLRVSRTLNGKAYTLDGREVKGTLQKGIYIIDGKKVVIK